MTQPSDTRKQASEKSKQDIAEEANAACHLPENKNGPDLAKGGQVKREEEPSDFA